LIARCAVSCRMCAGQISLHSLHFLLTLPVPNHNMQSAPTHPVWLNVRNREPSPTRHSFADWSALAVIKNWLSSVHKRQWVKIRNPAKLDSICML